jgi:effector-binding domain-containing protein
MKRAIGLTLAGAAIACLALGAGQTTVRVTILEMEPFSYASLSHSGPYDAIPEVVGRLLQSLQEQTIAPTGPVMVIFHNDPGNAAPSELSWEVGFPVAEVASLTYHESDEPNTEIPLKMNQWTYTRVAVSLHSGSYESTQDTITAMMEWIKENGYEADGPVVERYTDMDDAGNVQDLKVEIWIPLKGAAQAAAPGRT